MFSAFLNSFKIPELRKRIVFTLAMLAVCRVSAWISVPGVDTGVVDAWVKENVARGGMGGTLLGMYDLFVGGALMQAAVGAMGIMPYISASIILQLMTAVSPQLARLAREGDVGRAKITQYSRYLAVGICLIQGSFLTFAFENPKQLFHGFDGTLVPNPGWGFRFTSLLCLTTASMLLMWMGEQISHRGIGNGVSLVITVGIVARLPAAIYQGFNMARLGQLSVPKLAFMLLLAAVVIAGIIAVTQAQRKIPIQHAKRIVGQKMVVGGQSFMPLRVNYSGVMPIIFAQAILMFPAQIFALIPPTFPLAIEMRSWAEALTRGSMFYYVSSAAMILFFSYFWVATQFHPVQIADDLKKYGGYIPGVRPGQPTADFLNHTMNRITLAGAIFLTIIAVIPDYLYFTQGLNPDVAQFFGGTSMLIAVGVTLDTMRQIESQLLMRHYDGFLRKGRLRGRAAFGGAPVASGGGLLSDAATRRLVTFFFVAGAAALAIVIWSLTASH